MTGLKDTKIVAAIQARMNSKRLPGKPLMKICAKSMLEHILERLLKSRFIGTVCVATSDNPRDDELARYLESKKIPYFRGPEEDIVGRLYGTAEKFKAETLVRVWGDCPLIDVSVIDKMLDEYFKKKADYATNSSPSSYPFGMNAEVYGFKALEEIFYGTKDPFYREFPIEYVKKSKKLKMINVLYEKDISDIKLTVDYPQDVEVISKIINHFSSTGENLNLDNIIKFYKKNREIFRAAGDLPRNVEYKENLHLRSDEKNL